MRRGDADIAWRHVCVCLQAMQQELRGELVHACERALSLYTRLAAQYATRASDAYSCDCGSHKKHTAFLARQVSRSTLARVLR